MDVLPITNILQYEFYCLEIHELMKLDPEPESEKGKRLSKLAEVIEEFEKTMFSVGC